MSTLEYLQQARALIEDPSHWLKRRTAEDADGFVVSSLSPDAASFCAGGAVEHVGGDNCEAYIALDLAARRRGYREITAFNDDPTTTHEDVMALYDEVIEIIRDEAD